MTSLPGLFQRTCSVVCHDRESIGPRTQLLIMQIRDFREQMLQYYGHLTDLLPEPGVAPEVSADVSLVYELLGTSLSALAMASRLLTALGDPQQELLEKDAISYATEVGMLEAGVISADGWASFYLSQKAVVAASVHRTAAIWTPGQEKIIEKWKFDRWCKTMRRETCNCTK